MRAHPALFVALALLFILSAGATHTATGPASAPVLPQGDERPLVTDGVCGGASVPSSVSGLLIVEGGPAPTPSTTGQTVSYSAGVTEETTVDGSTTATCTPTVRAVSTTATVNASTSSFALNYVLPTGSCGDGTCRTYTGPYAPAHYLVASTPAGYFTGGSGTTIAWIWALSSVTVSTAPGTTDLAAGSSLVVTATALAANDGPSPLASPTFTWAVVGDEDGWSFPSSSTGAEVTFQSPSQGGSATFSVEASGVYGGATESTPAIQFTLDAIPVSGGSLSASPAAIDSGQAVTLTTSGVTGYAGATYTELVYPTSSTSDPTSVPCTTDDLSGPTAEISCETTVSYTNSGTSTEDEQPWAVVTDGDADGGTLEATPEVTVAPLPTAGFADPPAVITANTTLTWDLTVAGGTGDFRFCFLSAPSAPLGCSPASSPPSSSFGFDETYTLPGTYTVHGYVLDGAGTNVSVADQVTVVWPLTLGSLVGSPASVDPGESADLSATLLHGATPVSIWWNASGGSHPCPSLASAGPGTLTCDFVPSWSGTQTVTLTTRDATGTQETQTLPVSVDSSLGGVVVTAAVGHNTAPEYGTLQDDVGFTGWFNATFSGGTAPYSYQFTYNGTLMADGTGSAADYDITFAWSYSGLYLVNFTVTDANLEMGWGTVWVDVHPPISSEFLNAEFGPTDVGIADNLSVIFAGGSSPLSFTWITGNGYQSTSTVPWFVYTWAQAGNFTLSVTVSDGAGDQQSASTNLVVNPGVTVPCAPTGNPNPTEVGISVTFNITCVTGGTPAYSYHWNFGDGHTAVTSLPQVAHVFTTPVGVSVAVTVVDGVGDSVTSAGLGVTVDPHLSVSIPASGSSYCSTSQNIDPIDAGVTDDFCARIQGGVGSASYTWVVDGTSLVGATYAFPSPGNYTLNVTATDSAGATSTATKVIEVVGAPEVTIQLSAYVLDANQTLHLSSQAWNGTGDPSTWTYMWKLDGTLIGTGPEWNYSFSPPNNESLPGIYTVTLTATDSEGGTGHAGATVSLLADPSGQISVSPGSVDEGSVDSATVTVAGGMAPYSYAWSVAGPGGPWTPLPGTTDRVSLPTNTPGIYRVLVNVTDGLGFTTEIPVALYTVTATVTATWAAVAPSPAGYALVGQVVTWEVCRSTGGVAPFTATVNLSGTVPTGGASPLTTNDCTTFNVSYPDPGLVWASAQVRDSGGAVTSVLLASVTIVEPAARPQVASTDVSLPVESTGWITANDSVSLARLTWVVPPSGDLAPLVFANGTLRISPTEIGTFNLEVTAQDAVGSATLGPALSVNLTLTVTAGAATSLEVTLSNDGYTAVVGTNYTLVWQALDAWQNPATTFSENVTLRVKGPLPTDATIFANTSLGPAHISANGSVIWISPSAWIDGRLTLSLSQHRSGTVDYTFLGALVPPSWPGGLEGTSLALTWTADLAHLELFSPTTMLDTASENATLWRISDLFGNPIPSGYVVVHGAWGSFTTTTRSPILERPSGSSVWVNYTVYGTDGGNVTVVSESGQNLLAPLEIAPSPPSSGPSGGLFGSLTPALGLALLVVVALIALVIVALARRRRPPAVPPVPQVRDHEESESEELARDAATLQALENGVRSGTSPTRLTDLHKVGATLGLTEAETNFDVQRLVTDGRLRLVPAGDGDPVPAYVRSPPPSGDVGGSTESPRLVLDAATLEAHLAQRSAEADLEFPGPED